MADAAEDGLAGDAGPTDDALGDTDDEDAGPVDAGPVDTGLTDVGPSDSGPSDSGPSDSGPSDSGPSDSGPSDTGPADTGPADTGPADTGPADTGPADTGPPDTTGCNVASDCDDGKLCTIDLCNPSDHTCDHKAHTGACDDGDPCTSDDACQGGSCKGGPAKLVRRLVVSKGVMSGAVSTIAGGQVAMAGRNDDQAFVMGFDANHQVAWTTPIGGGLNGAMEHIMPAPVTGYVAGGWRKSTGNEGTDGYIAHVGQTGALQKSGKIIGSYLYTEVRALLPKNKTQVVFAGISNNKKNEWRAVYGAFDITQGKTVANLSYFGSGSDRRGANGLVALGKTNGLVGWSQQGSSQRRGCVSGLDAATGFIMFGESHGSTSFPEELNAGVAMSDGGLLLVGASSGTASGLSDAWLLRTDKVGKKLWSRTMGSDASDAAMAVLATGGGGALIVGQGAMKSAMNALGAVWQVDAWGNLLWQRTTNPSGNERLSSVAVGPEALLVSGAHKGTTGNSFVLMRMDSFGHVTCGASGVCAAKKLPDCDDGKVCTADDCDPGKGCVHPPMAKAAVCGASAKKTCDGAGACL